MTFHRNTRAALILVLGGLIAAGANAAESEVDRNTDLLLQQMAEISERLEKNADWLSEAGSRTRQISEGEEPEELPEEDMIQAPLPPIEAPPGSDPVLIMTARMTRFVNRSIEITNRYQQALTDISVETLLNPVSYATKEAAQQVPDRLAKAELAYRRMVRESRENTRAFAAEMRSGDLPAEAIAGFNASFKDGRVIEEQIAMEGRILIAMSATAAFVLETRPEVETDTFLFQSDEHVTAYNGHAARLAELIDEQAAMMRAHQATMTKASQTIQRSR
jgi:hypothetical protein